MDALRIDAFDEKRYWQSKVEDESPTLDIQINSEGSVQVIMMQLMLKNSYFMEIHCGSQNVISLKIVIVFVMSLLPNMVLFIHIPLLKLELLCQKIVCLVSVRLAKHDVHKLIDFGSLERFNTYKYVSI